MAIGILRMIFKVLVALGASRTMFQAEIYTFNSRGDYTKDALDQSSKINTIEKVYYLIRY